MAVSPDALICVRTEKCGISKSVRRQAAAESSLESILGADGKKRQKASYIYIPVRRSTTAPAPTPARHGARTGSSSAARYQNPRHASLCGSGRASTRLKNNARQATSRPPRPCCRLRVLTQPRSALYASLAQDDTIDAKAFRLLGGPRELDRSS